MKQRKVKKKESGFHSFYREAEKNWLKQSQSSKTTFKKILKFAKYALYLFLAITTIWGCAQNFIIKTNPQVSQGLEVYMSNDLVIPNFYKAEAQITYQVSTEITEKNDDEDSSTPEVDENGWINQNGLAPLPFLVENNEFGRTAYYEPQEDDTLTVEQQNCYDNQESPKCIKARDINLDGKINNEDIKIWESNLETSNYDANSTINASSAIYIKPAQQKYFMSSNYLPSYSYQVSTFDPYFLSNYLTVIPNQTENFVGEGYMMYDSTSFFMTTYDFPDNYSSSIANTTGGPVPAWFKLENDGNYSEDENLDGNNVFAYTPKVPSDYQIVDGKQVIVPVDPETTGGPYKYADNILIVPKDYTALTYDQYWDQKTIPTDKWTYYSYANISNTAQDSHQLFINQAYYVINSYAFVNPESLDDSPGNPYSSLIKLEDTSDSNSNKNITLEQLINEMKAKDSNEGGTYASQYNDLLAYHPNDTLKATTFNQEDYQWEDMGFSSNPILPTPPPNTPPPSNEDFGAGLVIIPAYLMSSPLLPSQEALTEEYMKGVRGSQWYEKEGYGADPKTANAGWYLLGEDETVGEKDDGVNNPNVFKLYKYNDNTYKVSDELATQQKTKNLGEHKQGANNLEEKVLEEKIYAYAIAADAASPVISNLAFCKIADMTFTLTSPTTSSSTSEEEPYKQTTYKLDPVYAPLIGMGAFTEMGSIYGQTGYISPDLQRGITYNTTKFDDSISQTPTENSTQSALDYSLQQAGYDPNNYSRYSMVTWSEAWAWGGPYYGIFVWPLSKLSLWVQSWMPYDTMGAWSVLLGILLIVFSLKGLAIIISYRKKNSQLKMQELQLEVANIKSKYGDHKKNRAMKQRMQLEIQALYRKHNVNPMSSMGSMLVTLPIFFAIYTIVSAIPVYKIASIGAFVFALTPLQGIFNTGMVGFIYLIVALMISYVQILSTKLPQWLVNKRSNIKHVDDATRQQLKKQNRTTTIMLVIFVILGLTMPFLLGIYWAYSSLFSCLQALIQHWLILRRNERSRVKT